MDEDVLEAMELFCEPSSIPAEEILVGAEDGREDIGRRFPHIESVEAVEPEVVFDEKGYIGVHQLHQLPGVATGVGRKVANNVGKGIVLAYFVARGGEESQADFVFGMANAKCFDDRSGLFELSKRRGMEPCDL